MNRFLLVTLLVIVVGCVAVNAADKDKCTDYFCTDVKGQSGKIHIWRGSKKGSANDALKFEMDYIKELDKDGNVVGNQGAKDEKHALETFAGLEFKFSGFYSTMVMGAQADAFNFTAKIPGPDATLTVEMFFINEDKTVDICGSEYKLKNGSMKFNIVLTGWKFCGDDGVSCKGNGNGSYVQMAALVTAPNGKEAKEDKEGKTKGSKEKGKNMILGDIVMKFPRSVKEDNTCKNMPDGYPMFNETNKKQTTTFKFGKFMTQVIYDPIVEYGAEESPTTGSSSLKMSFILIAFLAGLVKLLC